MSSRRIGSALAVAVLLGATVRAEDGGGLVGWVESTRGAPVAGAVISVFGEGIRGGSLVTLADSEGQFILPSLPPGSYTLRAIGTGHLPSAAERVTVLPNRDSLFTLSLTPVGDKSKAAEGASGVDGDEPDQDDDSLREWRWLLRHKRRSVLETASHEAAPSGAAAATSLTAPAPQYDALGPLAGRVELVALSTANGNGGGPPVDPDGVPSGLGTLKLHGKLADSVHWSLGGLLAETGGRSWRMAAEFVLEPGGGHEIQTGAGYGAGYTRALLPNESPIAADRSVGAFFVRDRWRVGERLTTSFGARYTYIGFLSNPHHADAVVQIELRGDPATVVHGSVATRTLAPGGDLLTLSTASASPAISWARLDDNIEASRTVNFEFGVDRSIGQTSLGAFAFGERTRDQLWTAFDDMGALSVRNVGVVGARGIGVRVGRRIGSAFNGTVTYTFGRASHPVWAGVGADPLGFEDAQFHDLVARVETFLSWTDTRVAALYRLNAFSDEGEVPPRASATTTARFDVQVTQGLPFLQPLTRADWDLLVAVSNIFYEASEGGFLDELTVQEPPTRVVGGISVRF